MKHIGSFICEKVIIDGRGAPSIITIMQNAHIDTIPGAEPQAIPPNAVMPKEWYFFSSWFPSSDEVGKNFEQVYQVYWPNGEKFSEARSEFTVQDETQYNTLYMQGLPVGQQGDVKIVTWLDHNGHKVSELVERILRIKYGPAPAPPPLPRLQVSR
jgi:hypothetical protein